MPELLAHGKVEIDVHGEHTLYHQPERCVVSITVSSIGDSQSTVSQEVHVATVNLRRMLEELAPKDSSGEPTTDAPVTYFTTVSVSTSSYRPRRDEGGKPLPTEYEERVDLEATFRSFSSLSSFVTTLSTQPHTSITHLKWGLTDATKSQLASRVRQAALKDAVAKANDFAEALGRTQLRVLQVHGGVNDGANLAAFDPPRIRYMRAASRDVPETIEVDPQEVRLMSTVTAKFEAQ